eukprot:m.313016 g.313016  ORF g.313016 m.313016 type:complete len:53 (-) comp446467_c0_seq1:49-207(-)
MVVAATPPICECIQGQGTSSSSSVPLDEFGIVICNGIASRNAIQNLNCHCIN